MIWFEDADFIRTLPFDYRVFAKYCAEYVDKATGDIPYGLWLFRLLGGVRRLLRLPTNALTRVGETAIVLDLSDPRAQLVYQEVSGVSNESRMLRDLLRPGDAFLDIGANHGGFSLIAARLVGPTGRVVAFEPQPHLAQQIARSFAANGFLQARVINCGLSNVPGRAVLYVPFRNSGSASVFREYMRSDPHATVEIQLERLDDLALDRLDTARIVVKMDLEGSERACLLGGARFFQRHLPDVIMEINPHSAKAGGYSVGDLIALLRSFGYTCFVRLERFLQGATLETEADAVLEAMEGNILITADGNRLRRDGHVADPIS